MGKFTATASAVTFGNIRWDCNFRPSYLCGQTVLLFMRPITRYPVDGRHELHRLLPDNQILIPLLPNSGRPAVSPLAAMINTLLRVQVLPPLPPEAA
jgi:hypothetical protein